METQIYFKVLDFHLVIVYLWNVKYIKFLKLLIIADLIYSYKIAFPDAEEETGNINHICFPLQFESPAFSQKRCMPAFPGLYTQTHDSNCLLLLHLLKSKSKTSLLAARWEWVYLFVTPKNCFNLWHVFLIDIHFNSTSKKLLNWVLELQMLCFHSMF